jgi:hypothetical protein
MVVLVIPAPALSQHKAKSVEQHIHVFLKVIMNSREITLPANIGIAPHLWHGHSLDNYSFAPGYIAPIHTHKDNDTLHVESTVFRRFTFGDFLYIWGIDQSKITNVTSNGEEIKNYKTLPLTDGQNLTLQIKLETSPKDFKSYTNSTSGLAFQYPSEWKVNPANPTNTSYISLLGENLLSIIEVFPPERNYLNAPYFTIEVDKLPSTNITLDQYTIRNLPLVMQGDHITFSKVNDKESIDYNFDNHPARKIVLEKSYINVNKSNDIVNEANPTYPTRYQKTMQIWTINNDKIYLISYTGYSYSYSEYLPTIEKILNSINLG